jgi:polar amino acid transport system substrate-binding protein
MNIHFSKCLGKLVSVIVLGAAVTVFMTACGGASKESTATGASSTATGGSKNAAAFKLVNPGYLTVATNGTNKPQMIVGSGNTLGGVQGDILTQFAKDHGLKLKLFKTTFESLLLAVQNGKVDVGPYMFYTPDRAKKMYYSAPYFNNGSTVIFTKKDFPYNGPASMEGKKVGSLVGYVWAPFLEKWSASNTQLYQDQAAAGRALLNDQIQGYIDVSTVGANPPLNSSKLVAHKLNAGDFGFPQAVVSVDSYMIVNCKNKELANALNNQLTQMKSNGQLAASFKANNAPESDGSAQPPPPQGC